MIKDDGLRAYADLLERNGFTIYESKNSTFDYFVYSRVVDGRECFGSVQSDRYNGGGRPFGGYSHTMPIKPSVKNGSSMWVEGVPDELTVEAAMAVARPTNHNHLVGTQENYEDAYWSERLYNKREGK